MGFELPGTAPPDWVAAHARARPDAIALTQGERAVSYMELDDQVARLAAAMVALGVRPGDRVATLLPNSVELVVTLLATLRVGAVALPMNPQYRESEIERHFDDARPRVIVAANEFTPLVNQVLTNRSFVNRVLIGCPQGQGAWYPFQELIEHHRNGSGVDQCDPNAPALWLHSSGSTGGSKVVSRSRAQLAAEAELFRRSVGVGADDVILCVAPLTHAHGFGNALLASAYAGARLVLMESFARRPVLRAIQDEAVTILPAVPFMYRMLAETAVREELDLSSLRLCFSAGAPLTPETFAAFRDRFGIAVCQLYGTTETGAITINLDDDLGASFDSVGRPLDGVEVEIFDREGSVLPAGQQGVVGIRSPAMFEGYQGREDLNKTALRNGFFFPGDRGTKDEAGRLRLSGRDTLFINLGANKVDPAEVEGVLSTHPKVSECVVLGAKQERGGDLVKAVIVPTEPFEEAEIIEYCRERIAAFKVPRIVEFRDEIPRSPLGKVLRKYLE